MSKKADEIVAELKKEDWESTYDNANVSFQKRRGFQENLKNPYYIHEWTVKNIEKGSKVLDVGCSIGIVCHLLKEKGCFPTGVDVSPKAIELAEKNVSGVPFKQMYAEQLEFQDGMFDVVCCNQVLEHLKEPEIAIKEMLRVLKPNGKLIITVPINKMLDIGVTHHIQHWRFYEIMDLFEKFGDDFKIYWLNKFFCLNHSQDEPHPKNIFGILFHKRCN